MMAASLFVAGCGGGSTPTPSPTPAPSNAAPVFTSAATVSLPENTSAVFYTATATDANGDAFDFSINGGADAAKFRITTAGALSFIASPDFENPTDADRNNVYQVTLAVSDGRSFSTLALSVAVTDVAGGAVTLRRIATTGLTGIVAAIGLDDGSGRLLVAQSGGRVSVVTPDGSRPITTFLDISPELNELRGITLSPNFATNGLVYLSIYRPPRLTVVPPETNASWEIRTYRVLDYDRAQANPASQQTVLLKPALTPVQQKTSRTNWIGFGPDGYLYATQDAGERGNINPSGAYGRVIRLDMDRDDFPTDGVQNYGIPSTNPYATSNTCAREVWADGFYTPGRASIDRNTGNVWIGDVGINNEPERFILVRPTDGGANFSPRVEDTCNTTLSSEVARLVHGGSLDTNEALGGFVYRGPLESIQGQYFYADITRFLTASPIYSFAAARATPSQLMQSSEINVRNDLNGAGRLIAFGEDVAGNLYLINSAGDIYMVVGA